MHVTGVLVLISDQQFLRIVHKSRYFLIMVEMLTMNQFTQMEKQDEKEDVLTTLKWCQTEKPQETFALDNFKLKTTTLG